MIVVLNCIRFVVNLQRFYNIHAHLLALEVWVVEAPGETATQFPELLPVVDLQMELQRKQTGVTLRKFLHFMKCSVIKIWLSHQIQFNSLITL